MKRRRKRKCLHCQALFHPDPRNRRHQKYCSETQCRKASKTASQRRWLSKKANKDYFRGPENVKRVQVWRNTHPEYWHLNGLLEDSALQDESLAQAVELEEKSGVLVNAALQDLLSHQSLVLIGLLAHISDSPLQDDIAELGQRLIGLGLRI